MTIIAALIKSVMHTCTVGVHGQSGDILFLISFESGGGITELVLLDKATQQQTPPPVIDVVLK